MSAGLVLHRRQHKEARGKITRAIDYLMRLAGDGGPPGGGAAPTH